MIQVPPPSRPLRWAARRASRFPTPLPWLSSAISSEESTRENFPASISVVTAKCCRHRTPGLSPRVSGSSSCASGALGAALATLNLPAFQTRPSRNRKGVAFHHPLSRSPAPGTGIVRKLQPRASPPKVKPYRLSVLTWRSAGAFNTGDVPVLPGIDAAGCLALRGVTWRYVVAHGRRRRCNALLRFQIGPCASRLQPSQRRSQFCAMPMVARTFEGLTNRYALGGAFESGRPRAQRRPARLEVERCAIGYRRRLDTHHHRPPGGAARCPAARRRAEFYLRKCRDIGCRRAHLAEKQDATRTIESNGVTDLPAPHWPTPGMLPCRCGDEFRRHKWAGRRSEKIPLRAGRAPRTSTYRIFWYVRGTAGTRLSFQLSESRAALAGDRVRNSSAHARDCSPKATPCRAPNPTFGWRQG